MYYRLCVFVCVCGMYVLRCNSSMRVVCCVQQKDKKKTFSFFQKKNSKPKKNECFFSFAFFIPTHLSVQFRSFFQSYQTPHTIRHSTNVTLTNLTHVDLSMYSTGQMESRGKFRFAFIWVLDSAVVAQNLNLGTWVCYIALFWIPGFWIWIGTECAVELSLYTTTWKKPRQV